MKARWLWLVMVVFLFVGGMGQTVWAGPGCFRQANGCFLRAARYTTWWERFTGTLDCELDLVSCVRTRLIGV